LEIGEAPAPSISNLQSPNPPLSHSPNLLRSQSAVIRLHTIFRQEAGSFIIANAHRINAGQMPVIDNEQATDFFLFRPRTPERAAQLCVELVAERIPRRFGIPPEEIQVLSPMHRGVIGVARSTRRCRQRSTRRRPTSRAHYRQPRSTASATG
jgi:ATP-dependent exoDNAse (exonuclease V) alpha subunit